jgi:hypothetical protein
VSRSAGERGAEIAFTDLCGVLRVVTRFDTEEQRFYLKYMFVPQDECLPAMLLPAMRFAAELQIGRSLLALINGSEVGPPIDLDQTVNETFLSRLKNIEMLETIQHFAGVYFAVPQSLSPDDLASIYEAHRLIDGETLVSEWNSLQATMPTSSPVATALRGQKSREITNLYTWPELLLRLGTNEYSIGQIRQTVRTARVLALEDVLDSGESEAPVRITFVPGDDRTMETRLITQDEPSP